MVLSVPEAKSRFNVGSNAAEIEALLTSSPEQPAIIYNQHGWLGFISAPAPHTQEQVRHLLDTLIQTSFDKAIIEAVDIDNQTVEVKMPTGQLLLVRYKTMEGGPGRLPYCISGIIEILSK